MSRKAQRNYIFFECTDSALTEITSLYDFVWPTSAALWNLRWQVVGYNKVHPSASSKDLSARFLTGSGIYGANIYRACIDQTWEEQKEIFAKFLLTNIISIYEGWVLSITDSTDLGTKVKYLQFPTDVTRNFGVRAAIDSSTTSESDVTRKCFYDSLVKHDKYNYMLIDNMMKCYRFFKESRNCISHRNSQSDQKLLDAYQAFQSCSSALDLGVKETPEHDPVSSINQPIKLSLRGVVGFCDIIIKIMTSIDIELSRSLTAEKELIKRWELYGDKPKPTLKGNEHARRTQISRLVNKLGLPPPLQVDIIEDFLVNNHLVSR